jgi:hypothetical protein
MVEKVKPEDVNKIETLKALKQHRTIPSGETIVRRIKPGEQYKQSGMAKVEAIAHGLATTDLTVKVLPNDKRVAPEKGKEKFKSPYEMLVEQNKAILEMLVTLTEKLTKK